ncbi:hypothetical protein OAM01_02020 [bacterium]|nr:hypothetical protein [bacterium]
MLCGTDTSNTPRFKDDQNQYYHESCYLEKPNLSQATTSSSPSKISINYQRQPDQTIGETITSQSNTPSRNRVKKTSNRLTGLKISDAIAQGGIMDRLRYILVDCMGGFKQPAWVWIATSFVYVLFLAGFVIPFFGFVVAMLLILIGPLILWIVSVSDAFQNTEVNRGWLVLLCPPYATRYLFKHSTAMFPRRIMNVLILSSLPLFIGSLFTEESDDEGKMMTIYSSEKGWLPDTEGTTDNFTDPRP